MNIFAQFGVKAIISMDAENKRRASATGIIGIVFLISVLLMNTIFLYDNKYYDYQARISNGVMKIDNSTFKKDNIYSLVDNWNYYDHAYVQNIEQKVPDASVYLGQYPDFSMRDTKKSPFGVSTYHLRLTNEGDDKNLSLFLPEVDCAYELYINKQLVVQNGDIKKERIVPYIKNQTVGFYIKDVADIVLIVGNDFHYYSGAYFPLMLSTPQGIADMNVKRILFYSILCVSSLTIALYCLGLWMKSQKSPIYICFGMIVISFGLFVSMELWRYIGFSTVSLMYAAHDFFYFLMLNGVLLLNVHISNQKNSKLFRFIIRPVGLFISILSLVHPLLLQGANLTLLTLYGNIIDGFKYLSAAYIIYTTYLGFKKKTSSYHWILAANTFYIIGVTYTLLYANMFEPVMLGWQNEYFSFIVVLLFAGYMIRRNNQIIVQNRKLTYHLEEQVEERTQQLDKLLEERKALMHEIAHDMKAPVSSIQSFSEQLRYVQYDDLREYVSIIEQKAEELSSRMKMLQEFSVMDAVSFKKRIFSMQDYLTVFHKNNKPDCDAAAIHFDLQIEETPVFVYADDAQLTRVFENLLFNALSYTPENGMITITQSSDYEYCYIDFHNSGSSIDIKQQEKIFHRGIGFRDNEGDHHQGIGLYIARTIILQHSGDISIDPHVKDGVTFHIRLPLHIFAY